MTSMNTSHIEHMKTQKANIEEKNFSNMTEEELDKELRFMKRTQERLTEDAKYLAEESAIDKELIELTTKPEMFRKVNPEWKYEELDRYWELKFQKFKKQQEMKLKFFEEEQKAYEDMLAFLSVNIEYVEDLIKNKEGDKK